MMSLSRHVVPAFAFAFAVALQGCSESGTVAAPASAFTPGALLSLAVTPLALTPAFSPDVHDYVVRCAAGDNELSLALQAAGEAAVSVTTPTATLSVVSDSVSITLSEDDPLIVGATVRGGTQSYWVRCLPHDFPAITFTSHTELGAATPGWYLTGNATVASGESGFAMILDGHGTPVWYQRVGPNGVMNVNRLPDGTLSYIPTLGAYGSDPNAQYVVQKLDPWQTRYVQSVSSPTDEHELQVLPNGDVLVFSYPFVEGVDLTGLGSYGRNSTIADCVIQEISPSGVLVWSWRGTDHIDPVRESTGPQTNLIDGLDVVDVFHFNSIDVDAKGNLLVSARDMDAVWYIDKASGTIVWKMGGAPYSKDGAQIIRLVGDPETTFNHQHDARFQPNGDVSLFDDHTNLSGPARGVEYAIDFTSGTATVVWQYAAAGNTTAMGSFRRYADGSNVIAWGLSSNPAMFTEVDDQGNDVLDVAIGAGDSAYRTLKVPVATFDADVLRVTAGHS